MTLKKKIQVLIGIALGVIIVVFVGVLLKYQRGSVPQTTEEEKKRELTVLSYYQEDGIRNALEELASEYMQLHKDVTVKVNYVNPASFQKEICMEKDRDDLSDIVICDNVMTPALESMGIFQDISSVLTTRKIDTLVKTAYRSCIVNGKTYSLPFTCDPYVLFYNKNYYEKNKIQKPKSLDEFVDTLKTVKTLGNYNLAIAGKDADDIASSFLQMIYLYGGTIMDLDGDNSQVFFDTMEELRNYNIYPRDMINWNQQDLMDNFSDGLVVNVIGRLSSMKLLNEEKMNFEYGIMEIPYSKNQAYLFHGENMGITKDCSDREVLDLFEFLTSEDSNRKFCDATAKMSVYVSYENNPGREKGLDDSVGRKTRYYGMEKKSYTSGFVITEAIRSQLTEFYADLSIDGKTAAKQMQDAVREAILERS